MFLISDAFLIEPFRYLFPFISLQLDHCAEGIRLNQGPIYVEILLQMLQDLSVVENGLDPRNLEFIRGIIIP